MFQPDLSDPKHTIITPLNAHNYPLRVTPHEVVDAGAKPVEVGIWGRSDEC